MKLRPAWILPFALLAGFLGAADQAGIRRVQTEVKKFVTAVELPRKENRVIAE